MSPITSFETLSQACAAGGTFVYRGQIVDENGLPIGNGTLQTLTLSILDSTSKAVINSVDKVSILNVDRGSLDADGNLAVTLQAPGDTALQVSSRTLEYRSLVLDWTYGSGRIGRHQVRFIVAALAE